MKIKTITLITINYNDYETTSKFIERIRLSRIINYIIIVDNNSTDDSANKLKKYEDGRIKVIQNPLNNGYGNGNNFGIRFAEENFRSDYYIISNPDIIVEDKDIQIILGTFNDNIAIVTGIMRNEAGEFNSKCAWRLPKYKDLLIDSVYLGKKYLLNIKYGFDIEHEIVSEVDVVSGSFFIINTKHVKDVGYFDNDTFLYHEENILCHKLKKYGYKVVINRSASYIHLSHSTVSKNKSGKIFSYKHTQNSARVYIKKCLNVGFIKLVIFDIFTIFGKMEFWLLETLKQIIKKGTRYKKHSI